MNMPSKVYFYSKHEYSPNIRFFVILIQHFKTIAQFRNIVTCTLVELYRRFGRSCCPHIQSKDGNRILLKDF